MNAITMDVFDAIPARLAFFSPRRFPILVGGGIRRKAENKKEIKKPTERIPLRPMRMVLGKSKTRKREVQIELQVRSDQV